MRKKSGAREHLTERQRDELITFLRDWLPEDVKQVYRALIQSSPKTWHYHPHFAGGIILEHALRGNGFTEKALGVQSLEPLWPELLFRAVSGDVHERRRRGHG